MLFVFYKMNSRIQTIRLQRDIDELFAEGRSLGRTGKDTSVISGKYLLRELPEPNAPALLLLYHAPKKFTKPAHERNKLKRWMREAVRISDQMKNVSELVEGNSKQLLILMRITQPPSKDCNWQHISEDIRSIAEKLRTTIAQP